MTRVRLLLLLLLALPGRAVAEAQTAAAAAPDTVHRTGRLSGTGAYVRLMAEADSLLKLRGGVHAEKAQLYLSWNAPWGMKGAGKARMPACGDTTAADTLYLSFFPGRASDHFSGFTAELRFLATGPDTLGPWWHMEGKGGENAGNLRVEWGPSPDIPGRQPWPVQGHGFVLVDRTPTAMRLRLLLAETLDDAGPLDSTATYTLCRVIFHHRRAQQLSGCQQPVAVQWAKATFGFALKDEPEVRRGERLVSWAGPYSICEPFHDEPGVKAWKPPPPASPPAVPGQK
jgi:hypothetical protein